MTPTVHSEEGRGLLKMKGWLDGCEWCFVVGTGLCVLPLSHLVEDIFPVAVIVYFLWGGWNCLQHACVCPALWGLWHSELCVYLICSQSVSRWRVCEKLNLDLTSGWTDEMDLSPAHPPSVLLTSPTKCTLQASVCGKCFFLAGDLNPLSFFIYSEFMLLHPMCNLI